MWPDNLAGVVSPMCLAPHPCNRSFSHSLVSPTPNANRSHARKARGILREICLRNRFHCVGLKSPGTIMAFELPANTAHFMQTWHTRFKAAGSEKHSENIIIFSGNYDNNLINVLNVLIFRMHHDSCVYALLLKNKWKSNGGKNQISALERTNSAHFFQTRDPLLCFYITATLYTFWHHFPIAAATSLCFAALWTL